MTIHREEEEAAAEAQAGQQYYDYSCKDLLVVLNNWY